MTNSERNSKTSHLTLVVNNKFPARKIEKAHEDIPVAVKKTEKLWEMRRYGINQKLQNQWRCWTYETKRNGDTIFATIHEYQKEIKEKNPFLL